MASRAIAWRFIACALIACSALPWASAATPAIVASSETLLAGHTCALTSEGRVYCWGHNDSHQLGQGSESSASSDVPAPVVGIPGSVVALAAGYAHACAASSEGSVWCWGENDWGQLGSGTANSSTPLKVPGLPGRAVALSASSNASCAVDQDGSVHCWGFPFSPPYRVSGITDAVQVSTTAPVIFETRSCAITRAGSVVCWRGRDAPTPVAGLSGIVAVDARSSCALSASGQVLCWGGDSVATAVAGVAGGRALDRSCAALADGTVRCWSEAGAAQPVQGLSNVVTLSAGTVLCVIDTSARLSCRESSRDSAPRYRGFTGSYRSVHVGGGFVCAVTSQGRAECAGSNESGQLGRGSGLTGSTTPVALSSLGTGVRSLAVGRRSGCAVTAQGTVMCWGAVGLSIAPTPTEMPGVSGVQSVVAGDGVTCALTGVGGVYCWGYIGGNSPYPIGGVSTGVASIAAGSDHACAVMQDGGARCWGDNDAGQLGNGSTTRSHTPAVSVVGLPGPVAAIAAGFGYSCAVTTVGHVYCWGALRWLGDESRSLVPVRVPGLEGIVSVAAGPYDACAVTAGGAVHCWGWDYAPTPRLQEYLPPSIKGVVIGGRTSCAWTIDGLAVCWGLNREGEVGDGTYAQRREPVVVRREGGGGTLAGNDWFLDLDSSRPSAVPGDKVPPFLIAASQIHGDVIAELKYNAQDVGTNASVYVFALAPENLVQGAAADPDLPLRVAATGPSGKSTVGCVLAQLDAAGRLVSVSSANLHAYVSGVVSGASQAVNVLNGVPATSIGGVTFLVGYGSSSSAMISSGNNQSVVTVPATVECRPEPPQTGWWWNPAESGRGFSIEMRGRNLFFASFLYDVSGRSTWYVSSGRTTIDGSAYSGILYAARGGQTLGGTYPGRPSLSNVGFASLGFSTSSRGTLSWPGGVVPIQRFDIVTNGLTLPPVAGQPQSGWWWNPLEDGRGFFLEFQGGTLDIAGYMYDDEGNPVWYLTVGALAGTSNARTFSGNWWSYGDGQTLTGPYRPNRQLSNNVAPLTINFTGPETAIMTLPNGRTTSLQRHGF